MPRSREGRENLEPSLSLLELSGALSGLEEGKGPSVRGREGQCSRQHLVSYWRQAASLSQRGGSPVSSAGSATALESGGELFTEVGREPGPPGSCLLAALLTVGLSVLKWSVSCPDSLRRGSRR